MTATSTNERVALFPGSFNPFTIGHADIVERGLRLFDRIIIAVGVNAAKPDAERREAAKAIEALYADEPRVEVAVYSELTVQLARKMGAGFILRGVRSVKDFEYERDMAQVNAQLSGIESVILFSRPDLAAISSSVVRELAHFGEDVSQFIPQK